MNIEQYKKDFARLGGMATKKKYGNDHFKYLNELSIKKRKENKLRSMQTEVTSEKKGNELPETSRQGVSNKTNKT